MTIARAGLAHSPPPPSPSPSPPTQQVAEQELVNLHRVKADIEDDLRRQRTKAHREAQKARWTMAPSGIGANRMGKSAPGVVIGPGPIPVDAMGRPADPYAERAMQRYYWDSAGRRHVRQEDADANASGSGSVVDQAMEAIRRVAKMHNTAELDLNAVFSEFDTSGNGILSIEEMHQAFLALGVSLEVEALIALFNHFDPNGSGGVRLGEFVWAFFNRRGLVRQWRRRTDKLTDAQIRSKFHAADVSGDGMLSVKEFGKFLTSFGVAISKQEQLALMEHFDDNGDGKLDLEEFKSFIVSEMMRLNAESNNLVGVLPAPGPRQARGASPPTSPPSPPVGATRPHTAPSQDARPMPPSLDISSRGGGGSGRAASAGRAGRSLIDNEESASPEFVAASLRAQHSIEQKLGHGYYP